MKDCCAAGLPSSATVASSARALPTFELRPGVAFPDWSVVTSPAARDSLTAILSAFDPAQRWGGYGDEEDRVRQAVIEGLAELDQGPDKIGRESGRERGGTYV